MWLFGSQADGTATPRSDIDLAVLFDRDIMLDEEAKLEMAVWKVLGTYDVSITNLTRAALPVRFNAICGKLLYERNYIRVSDFIERALAEQREYSEFMKRSNEEHGEETKQNRSW